MKQDKAITTAKNPLEDKAAAREGLRPAAIRAGANLSERTVSNAFSLVREVQNEISSRVGQAIDLVDQSQQSVMRIARGANERVTSLSRDVVDAAEDLSLRFVRQSREALTHKEAPVPVPTATA